MEFIFMGAGTFCKENFCGNKIFHVSTSLKSLSPYHDESRLGIVIVLS